ERYRFATTSERVPVGVVLRRTMRGDLSQPLGRDLDAFLVVGDDDQLRFRLHRSASLWSAWSKPHSMHRPNGWGASWSALNSSQGVSLVSQHRQVGSEQKPQPSGAVPGGYIGVA